MPTGAVADVMVYPQKTMSAKEIAEQFPETCEVVEELHRPCPHLDAMGGDWPETMKWGAIEDEFPDTMGIAPPKDNGIDAAIDRAKAKFTEAGAINLAGYDPGFVIYDEMSETFHPMPEAGPKDPRTIGEKRQDELHAIGHAIDITRKLEALKELLIYHSLVPHVVNESRVEFLVVKDSHEFHEGTDTGGRIGAELFSLAGGFGNEIDDARDRFVKLCRDELIKLGKGGY